MRIELESPYKEVWSKGYVINHKKQGRKYLVLCDEKSRKKSCTLYARYLLAVKIGRFLNGDEQVDHIDNDKTNDAIENLQLLTKYQNIKKSVKKRERKHGSRFFVYSGCECEKCRATRKRWSLGWYERNKDAYNKKRREQRKILRKWR